MNLVLAYDTETQSLPLFNLPSEHPEQPHIVQLAACLFDLDTRKVLNSFEVVIRPDGWTIPAETTKVHGIDDQYAMAVGVNEGLALELFLELWRTADFRVAHNEGFDSRIIRIGMKRNSMIFNEAECDAWKAGKAECTARLSTPICALPPTEKMKAAKRFHHKTPNLGEAYKFFTGDELDGAHRAMVDVEACMRIFFGIRDRESVAA